MDHSTKPHHIIRGQPVSPEKKAFARQQRKEISPVERVLWNRLRGNQIAGAHFRRQQAVAGFVADFYCHSAGLAVEVDGWTHDDPDYDARRDKVFAANGIQVMRFTNEQVLHEMDDVLQAIWECVTKDRTSP